MASKSTSSSSKSDPDQITLISEEGDSFKISRAAALRSGTIKSTLQGTFVESETNTVNLQIRSPVLEKVVEYLEWAHKFSGASEGTRVPDFEKQIPPELALELLMTADFLDV
ncbi:POZ domain-containing protein [Microstroma glucosiphilum]|uniref:Elongin-C n=1 Tax=Pseudomicrostroma glucosiphilum TaxID=1684307 RepID=A0A316UB12_9BASI|nr:POZ domain-containing protein [Pseudomicrostroma glucosiphilum]PWN22034.1 POZ domain-containing protein [Pseudomicrostroma glucosiphilum]